MRSLRCDRCSVAVALRCGDDSFVVVVGSVNSADHDQTETRSATDRFARTVRAHALVVAATGAVSATLNSAY